MSGLLEVQGRIEAAAEKAGRDLGSVSLIAVSKVQPLERVEEVLAEGHRVYGENRVQEAAGKWPAFRERYPDIELHLIGPLQTNKVRQALDLFDAIHSVDREKLARKLADDGIVVYAVHIADSEPPDQIVQITSMTGGEVFNPGDRSGLDGVFQSIDEMQVTRIEKTRTEAVDDYGALCRLGLGLLAAALLAAFGVRYTPW